MVKLILYNGSVGSRMVSLYITMNRKNLASLISYEPLQKTKSLEKRVLKKNINSSKSIYQNAADFRWYQKFYYFDSFPIFLDREFFFESLFLETRYSLENKIC